MTELTTAEAAGIARGVIIAACGGRWVSPPVRMTDTYPIPASGRVILSGRPVVAVHSVLVDGAPWTAYQLLGSFELDLNPLQVGRICAAENKRATVDYTYGQDELPTMVQRAVDVLADEILLAASGSNQCRIPERVTSVTRQGVSWTMLDPQEFLDKGRTGIYEIDLIIHAANPSGARRRVRVFSPVASALPDRRIS